MSRLARAALSLRTVLLVSLAALLAAGLGTRAGHPTAVFLAGEAEDTDDLARALLADTAPPALLRAAGRPPTETELALLAEAAERSPLMVERPAVPSPLEVEAPETPFAGRAAALRFVARGEPEDTAVVRLMGPGEAILDSAVLVADGRGTASGAFRVRPASPGWMDWGVAMGDQRARAGAWVAPAEPPRVLVVTGPPSWESRYAVRALERAGVEVALVQRLGRGNVVTAGGAPVRWWTEEALADRDALLLLAGAEAGPEALRALEAYGARGRGVLLAAGAVGLAQLGPAGGVAAAGALPADSLSWSAPPEIAPLPTADLSTGVLPFRLPSPAATVAARTAAGEPVLILAPLGRGRVAGLGLLDTWRWALRAGHEAEHRAFWRSLADWLSAPAADSLGVRLEPAEAAAGATVDVRFHGSAAAPELTLQRPGGVAEPLSLADAEEGRRARFVTADTGVHVLRAGGVGIAAFRATLAPQAPAAELGRARLAMVADATGGEALDAATFREHRMAMETRAGGLGGAWRVALFAALVALALLEWSLRRLRGLP